MVRTWLFIKVLMKLSLTNIGKITCKRFVLKGHKFVFSNMFIKSDFCAYFLLTLKCVCIIKIFFCTFPHRTCCKVYL